MTDPDHALIKVARLWSWQTEHFIPERPTYVVDIDTIESVLGPNGPAALVRARLATEVDGGYRLHGTEGQIEWCQDLSSKRQHAGRARAVGAHRDHLGRLLPTNIGESAHNQSSTSPAPVQHVTSTSPAQSSAPSPSPSPSPDLISDPPIVPQGGRRSARSRSAVDATPAELASVRVVLDRLSTESGIAYRGSDAHTRLILGRLREGTTELELRAVVAYCGDQWRGKPEMQQYLRPETLFGPQTIARYLDPARTRYARLLAASEPQQKLEVVR